MQNIIVIPHGHGHMDTDTMISVYIAFLIPSILIFLIRAIIWLFKKKENKSFYNYVIFDDDYNLLPSMNTFIFIAINCLFGFIAFVGLIIYLRK